ncbi:MAG TPA: 5'-deoxyadenosine deaminase [Symbiobacteriaceae bacterium]|nr:5'-deoxyadenosine deaminase [Symbiobacteriaceae bacterium]
MKTLIRGGTLVTVDPDRRVLPNTDLLVDGDRIAAIGPGSDAAGADRIIEARGKVVMPGLIQTHIHLCQTLFRGQADDLELLDWLQQRILPLEAAHDEDSVYHSALLGIGELLRGGTTAIVDMETVHHTDAAFHALAESGIRALAGKVMIDCGPEVPPGLCERTEAALEESVRLMERWHDTHGGRLRYAFCPRFVVTCSETLLREVQDLAERHGVHIHTHASENRAEIAYVEADRGMRNVRYLDHLGLASGRLVLAHCVHVDEQEIDLLAARRVHVAHCPGSNLKLASGIARIPQMLKRGVNVSLGADGAACNNNLDGFLEMRLAALIQKPLHGPRSMPAQTVLEMATIAGARAMGLADQIGSLEAGKQADLAIVDLSGLHTWPPTDVVSSLVYGARASDVTLTMVGGRILHQDGRLLTIETERVQAGAAAALSRLLRRIPGGNLM